MKVGTQKIREISSGIIQGVDASITPRNSVYILANLALDKVLGSATIRKGITIIGSQIVADKAILGLFQHITTGGTKKILSVVNDATDTNSDVFYSTGSAWTIATGSGINLTQGLKSHFTTFLDTTLLVNGTEAITTTDGIAFVNTGGNLDVGNMPKGKYVREWKDRIYTAGVSSNPDRLYYSSTPTSGVISWTTGNGYIDIEPEDGAGSITGLAKVPGYILILKERSLKRWDSNSTYPESLIEIGTPSQEAIVQTKQSVFYFNKRGIYETIGGYPRKISRKIQDIIDSIPSSYYSSVSGWGDGENVYFSIGNITIDNLTFNNSVVCYNLNSQNWTLFYFPNQFVSWYHFIDSNSDEIIIAGDNAGNVFKVLNGSSDNGSDINWLIQYQTQEFGSRGRTTDLSSAIVYNKNVRNGKLSVRVENNDFKFFGNVKNDVEEIKNLVKGRYFDFRLTGSGLGDITIIGIDFPNVNVNKNYNE